MSSKGCELSDLLDLCFLLVCKLLFIPLPVTGHNALDLNEPVALLLYLKWDRFRLRWR